MKKTIVTFLLLSSLAFPGRAHAGITEAYSDCQRSCRLNGLSCVFRCLAMGGSNSPSAPVAPSHPQVQIFGTPYNISVWGNGTTTTSTTTSSNNSGNARRYQYSGKPSSIRSTARNFAPTRAYNSGQ